jgi:DNA topoisomerase I
MTKNLVIVESPTKAKTIKKFLGKDYVVHASMGHVRDLPSNKLSIDVENDFEPLYEVSPDKKTVIKNLQSALNEAEKLWIATDEDREGEAIGWHLLSVLKRKNKQPVERIVFHEITKTAIDEAIKSPRTIDEKLVNAQQARRILDRLVGYTLSPFLWKKVYRGLSAGRVQSVAVRIIVDREREIQAFTAEEYWSVTGHFVTQKSEDFTAELQKRDGKKYVPTSQAEIDEIMSNIHGANAVVDSVDEKELTRNPSPPFTTSTLQQEASRKLGFSVKQTMVVAQQLYEGINLGKALGTTGLITYMRTDSVNLSTKALDDAKTVIQKQYGREYVLSTPRLFKTKSKSAQEAHEAIRPTELERTPESLKSVLDSAQLKLYTLIWNRTIACQMQAAELKRIGADIAVKNYTFRATGQSVVFDGFLRVYSEGIDEPEHVQKGEEKESIGEKWLPALHAKDRVNVKEYVPEQHFTKPPPRYTEASLVKKLEEEGIGRPSTYAPTISTVQQRGYIRKEGQQLHPEDIAFTVTDLLTEHFSDIVDLAFTADMEDKLDTIAEGKTDWVKFLRSFYTPFESQVSTKTATLSREDVVKERVLGTDESTGLPIIALSGRFGPYVQIGRKDDYTDKQKPRSSSLPKGKTTETITLEEAKALLAFPRMLGKIGADEVQVVLGRFGPYLKVGTSNVSLPEGIDPITLTLEGAKEAIDGDSVKKKAQQEPIKVLGKDPTSKGEISVKAGRFGPYITDGTTNVSVPKRFAPEDIDLVTAVELLDKKRSSPKKAWRGKKK